MAKYLIARRTQQQEFSQAIRRFKHLYSLDANASELLDRWLIDERAEEDWAKINQLAKGQGRRLQPQTLVTIVLEARHIAATRKQLDSGINKTTAKYSQLANQAEDLGQLFAELSDEEDPTSDSARTFVCNSRQYIRLSKWAANVLRELADSLPSLTAGARMSRSDRDGSAERTAFMSRVAHHLSQLCGRPCHGEVATLTEIAFPGREISIEQVRNAIARPTTRVGRKPHQGRSPVHSRPKM
jgi:hypothetical protein